MLLTQHPSFPQFYLFAGHKHLVAFLATAAGTSIDAAILFQPPFNKKFFYLLLHDEYTDTILQNSISGLNTEIGAATSSQISWIEDYGAAGVIVTKNAPLIALVPSGTTLTGAFNNFDYAINFKLNSGGNLPVLTFTDAQINLVSPGDIALIMDQKTVAFRNAGILLDATNCGALNFTNTHRTGVIQPTSPYLNADNDRLTIHYFDQTDYDANSNIEVFYFPYPNRSNINGSGGTPAMPKLSTRLVVNNTPLKTNLIDTLGFQTVLDNAVTSHAGYTKFFDSGSGLNFGPFFHFMPLGDMTVKQQNENVLLGFNGTESVANKPGSLTLTFNADPGVQADGEKLNPSLNSCTAVPSLNYSAYHLDAEKTPSFDNSSQPATTMLESLYAPIQIKTNGSSNPLRIIPTLTLKDNPGLSELEKTFTKLRLTTNRNAPEAPAVASGDPAIQASTAPTRFITPQGFLRKDNTLDFIKPDSILDESNKTVDVKLQATNVALTSDFYFSVCKEDVFFVLRPSMLKTGPEQLAVSLFIKGFSLDLGTLDPNKIGDDTFIIFKFSRSTFDELLDDTSKWSNYGKYKVNLDQLASDVNAKIKFPATADYQYFNQSIRKDPNWNGVVIVNLPITSRDQLPSIFKGLGGFQQLDPDDKSPLIPLQTKMRFQYLAFTVNKTGIQSSGSSSAAVIQNTSWYGLMDYDVLDNPDGSQNADYNTVSTFFDGKASSNRDSSDTSFFLTKLLMRFENSELRNFQSYAFIQVFNLFENAVTFDDFALANPGSKNPGAKKHNLILLNGNYQRNSAGKEEFNFTTQTNLVVALPAAILKSITITKLGFSYSPDTKQYRFDVNAGVVPGSWGNDFFSIDQLTFQNIGIVYSPAADSLPALSFDPSKLIIDIKIDFSGKGFLSSFPLQFSHFECFQITKKSTGEIDIAWDYFLLPGFTPPPFTKPADTATIFCFVFDFDLGTLGNLEALKALKGQLAIGWTFGGGFGIGAKFGKSTNSGLHIDLFGAVKLDIAKLEFCTVPEKPAVPPPNATYQYLLKITDGSLTIFGQRLPSDSNNVFNALIFAKPGGKTAWLFSYVKGRDPIPQKNRLLLGLGQHVGDNSTDSYTTVREAVNFIKTLFDPTKNICPSPQIPTVYQPDRNWLVASDSVLPDDWPIELAFIFNDPTLYGLHLGFKGDLLTGFSIDILYKKLSQNLGVYDLDLQLPNELRNHELGGAFLRLPNIGIQIYTNGDWKVDIGFPASDSDWSRSGFIQLQTTPPFVGWFGFYLMVSKTASLTLFNKYIDDDYSNAHLRIIQAGFAVRVGLGDYIDMGILYLGASITVYSILEGAFAFERNAGLASLFPEHFAVQGRMGAIAEVVGYVDFGIIKASVYLSLQAEFGILLVYLGKAVPGINTGPGLQPVRLYIGGRVEIQVSLKIGCVSIHLGFSASVRFEFTIGSGNAGNAAAAALFTPTENTVLLLDVPPVTVPIAITNIRNIPMHYLPAFSKVRENGAEQLRLIHSFFIPFFAKSISDGKMQYSTNNIFRTKIIQPFFNDLLTGLNAAQIVDYNSYQTLRSILLSGDCLQTTAAGQQPASIQVSVSGYQPTFIQGINSADSATVDTILQKFFGFVPGEPITGKPDNSITTVYADELLLIPAPIVNTVQVVDQNNNPLGNPSTTSFDLTIKGLFNGSGGTSTVTTTIGQITDYDDATLKHIAEFFDDYKTQFVDRAQGPLDEVSVLANKDIRTEVIVPEFFKLIGLLMLDAVYNDANPKSKTGDPYNPFISIDANGNFILDSGNPINPDQYIEQVVKQLNYFYNNGLRLPKDMTSSTVAFFELLQQDAVITPLATFDAAAVQVSLNNQDITAEVVATDNSKRDMWQFIGQFGAGFSLDNLRNEISASQPATFTRPFNLVPVTLSIQNGKLEDPGVCRLFSLPVKLSQQAVDNTMYSFDVNYTNATAQKNGKDVVELSTNPASAPAALTGFTKCLNVEMHFIKHSPRVFELVNVQMTDYLLMNALHAGSFAINNIDLYFKPDPDPSKPQDNISIQRMITTFFTVLKTNLSPRTFPPAIPLGVMAALDDTGNAKAYYDDSNAADTTNFIRLLWEAVTTNDGGYYLITDQDVRLPNDPGGKELTTGTLLLSFAGDQNSIPSWFNGLKISGNQPVLDGLKDKTHYLYLDNLKLTNASVAAQPVLEYHPTIPAHTMGFNVTRNRAANPQPTYNNYIPLEFGLSKADGTPILSSDQVLPVMPVAGDATTLTYSHLTPLLMQEITTDPYGGNIDRYKAAGGAFTLSLNVRDTFGHRTNFAGNALANVSYKHYYFDKLVPIDAWPMIHFSYWLASVGTNQLNFALVCQCKFQEILDLAGIDRDRIDPADPNKGFKYRYGFGDIINKSNTGDTKTDIQRLADVIPGVLNKLYTIQAQLRDSNTLATLNGQDLTTQKNNWQSMVQNLVKSLNDLLQPGKDKLYRMPAADVPAILNFPFTIALPDPLKNKLAVKLSLTRGNYTIDTADDAMFPRKQSSDPALAQLTSAYVWDFGLTRAVTSAVQPVNPAPPPLTPTTGQNPSMIGMLDTAIRTAAGSPYSLGVSSEAQPASIPSATGGKVIYVLNRTRLSAIRADNVNAANQFDLNCYFGILPFNTKLWSGDYTPSLTSAVKNSFTGIDLDKALRAVLDQIDTLLQGNGLSPELYNPPAGAPAIKDLYNKLIGAKMTIVDKKLKRYLAWAMDSTNMPAPSDLMIAEFRSLLLSGLDNFYTYDGIIRTTLKGLEVLGGNHRLSLSLNQAPPAAGAPDTRYNLVSSKPGIKGNDWFIIFDQPDNLKGHINFACQPQITHLEFDITRVAGSDIEHSTWIQLVTPVTFGDVTYSVKDWPNITREFPDKAVITTHAAAQQSPDPGPNDPALPWLPSQVGLWNYDLGINDTYVAGDVVHVDLQTQLSGPMALDAAAGNLEGFIAFWYTTILAVAKTSTPFAWKDFINDLDNQMSLLPTGPLALALDTPAAWSFELHKTQQNPAIWEILPGAGGPVKFPLGNDGKPDTSAPSVVAGPFNIFDQTNRVASILPFITVIRNRDIANNAFVYTTEKVQATSPATPHISYFGPMILQPGDTFAAKVFDLSVIPGDLPLKATAKYLIDTAGKDASGANRFPNKVKTLPNIPVKQIECNPSARPASTDALFTKFDPNNGFAAFAVTVYQPDGSAGSTLPLFSANMIIKPK